MKIKQEGPHQFQWAVDQDGYERHEVPSSDSGARISGEETYIEIRRLGGPWREYRPAEADPGLARRFASLPETEDAVLDFVNTYGLLGAWHLRRTISDPWPKAERLEEIIERIRDFQVMFKLIDTGHRQEALEIFNARISPPMTIRISGGGPRKPNLELVPLSLNSFMHLQLVNEITGRDRYTRCEQCPTWFPYRPKKQFCSDRCRKAWHRHHKE
jgi:hypothetical protein